MGKHRVYVHWLVLCRQAIVFIRRSIWSEAWREFLSRIATRVLSASSSSRARAVFCSCSIDKAFVMNMSDRCRTRERAAYAKALFRSLVGSRTTPIQAWPWILCMVVANPSPRFYIHCAYEDVNAYIFQSMISFHKLFKHLQYSTPICIHNTTSSHQNSCRPQFYSHRSPLLVSYNVKLLR
jgi:hypothetical protein